MKLSRRASIVVACCALAAKAIASASPLDTGETCHTLASGLTFSGFAFGRGKLVVDEASAYWFDGSALVSVPKVGGTVRTVAGGLGNVNDFAVDETHLYWTEVAVGSGGGAVKKTPKAGGAVATLATGFPPGSQFDVFFPQGIVLDGGFVYWGELVGGGAIRRVSKQGGEVADLGRGQGFGPVSMVVDPPFLYGSTGSEVGRIPLSDGDVEILATGLDNASRLTQDETALYWVHRIEKGEILRLEKAGGAPQLLADDAFNPPDLAVDDAFVYYPGAIFDERGNAFNRILKVPKMGGPSQVATECEGGGIDVDDAALYATSGDRIIGAALRAGACVPTTTTLCLDDQPGDRRFAIRLDFETAQGGGAAGSARAIDLASLGLERGGVFWFFDPDNPELLVKVLDGCSINGHHWVFASAGTNVGFDLRIEDTLSGETASYQNLDFAPATPLQDTTALPCLPAQSAGGDGVMRLASPRAGLLLAGAAQVSTSPQTELSVVPSVTSSAHRRCGDHPCADKKRGTRTLELTAACFDFRGAPIPFCELALSAAPGAGSGGHAHQGGRPLGTFDPVRDTSGSDGLLPVLYTAPEAAGEIDVTVTGTAPFGPVEPGRSIVRVAVPGLKELAPRPQFILDGETDIHPKNHFGTPGFNRALTRLAEGFSAMTGQRLEYNDMSLREGGVFDLKANWRPKHSWHRFGIDVDMQIEGNVSPGPLEDRPLLAKLAKRCGLHVFVEGNHWHLQQTGPHCAGESGSARSTWRPQRALGSTSEDRISVSVAAETSVEPDSGRHRYRYTVRSEARSELDVDFFAIATNCQPQAAEAPEGWTYLEPSDSGFASWAATEIGPLPPDFVDDGGLPPLASAIAPGESLGGFSLTSDCQPQEVTFYATPEVALTRVEEDLGELPLELQEELADFTEESFSDTTVGPQSMACEPNATVLCVDDEPGDGRFRVEVAFSTVQSGGAGGAAGVIPLSSLGVDRGGVVWFFSDDNPEMLIKVLDGCAVNDHHWVFFAAATNVGTTVTVTDMRTGTVRSYQQPDLRPAEPVQDTLAFPCS